MVEPISIPVRTLGGREHCSDKDLIVLSEKMNRFFALQQPCTLGFNYSKKARFPYRRNAILVFMKSWIGLHQRRITVKKGRYCAGCACDSRHGALRRDSMYTVPSERFHKNRPLERSRPYLARPTVFLPHRLTSTAESIPTACAAMILVFRSSISSDRGVHTSAPCRRPYRDRIIILAGFCRERIH